MGFRTRLADIIGSLIIILTHPVRGGSFSGLLTQHTVALDGVAMWKSAPAVTRRFDHTGRHDYSHSIMIPVSIEVNSEDGTRVVTDTIADGNPIRGREHDELGLNIAIHLSTYSRPPTAESIGPLRHGVSLASW